MKEEKKKEYQFTFSYNEGGKEIAVTIKRRGKVVSLSPKDFSVRGRVLILNRNPDYYFNPLLKGVN